MLAIVQCADLSESTSLLLLDENEADESGKTTKVMKLRFV